MDALADHGAAVKRKQENNRMHLEQCALGDNAERQALQDPLFRRPVRHEANNSESGGDGGALEVFALARGVLGHGCDGDVEAR